jgi:hypothetical protein
MKGARKMSKEILYVYGGQFAKNSTVQQKIENLEFWLSKLRGCEIRIHLQFDENNNHKDKIVTNLWSYCGKDDDRYLLGNDANGELIILNDAVSFTIDVFELESFSARNEKIFSVTVDQPPPDLNNVQKLALSIKQFLACHKNAHIFATWYMDGHEISRKEIADAKVGYEENEWHLYGFEPKGMQGIKHDIGNAKITATCEL